MAPETRDVVDWVQILDVASEHFKTSLAVDEATHGIKHMMASEEIPIWVTVAIQVHFDIEMVLKNKNALTRPFADYQKSVREAATQFAKIDPTKRPFLKHLGAAEDVGSYYKDMRNTIKEHRKTALENRLGEWLRKEVVEDHVVLGKVAYERDWFLKRNPIRCGLLEYELQLQINHGALRIEHLGGDILYMAWLYMVGSRILHPDAPRWPDMEYLLYRQQDQLVSGEFPKTIHDVVKELNTGHENPTSNLPRNKQSKQDARNVKQLRRLEDPSVMGALFMERLHAEPESTAKAHKWLTKLSNLICKPESQKILDRQENLPEGTYETSGFLRSATSQREPLALLEQLRQWLLADENDVHFDWLTMLSTCMTIWNDIMPSLRDSPIFKDNQDDLDSPDSTVVRLLEAASGSEHMTVGMSLLEAVWQTTQQTVQRPVSTEMGSKTWVGDLGLAKLLDTCNPALMLMNPGPVNFLKIYANWSEDDKKDSRVGRAVWQAIQACGTSTKTTQNNKDDADEVKDDEKPVGDNTGDEDQNSGESDSEEYDSDDLEGGSSDDEPFTAQQYTVNFNALSRGSKGNTSNMNEDPIVSRETITIPLKPRRRLRATGRVRVEMLPPREEKHGRAIATTEDAPELCACGLGRYGASVRPIPIPKMDSKAAKEQHECIGALFQGID